MTLKGIFSASTERFIVNDLDYGFHVILNSRILPAEEFPKIEKWCNEHHCTYYNIGVIEFPDLKTFTMFILKWA